MFAPPQIEPEGVGSLNPDAQIPNRHAQPDHSPLLDATRAENTPFGFPIRPRTDSDQAVFFVSAFESCPDR